MVFYNNRQGLQVSDFFAIFLFLSSISAAFGIVFRSNQLPTNYISEMFLFAWVFVLFYTKRMQVSKRSLSISILIYLCYLPISVSFSFHNDLYYSAKAMFYAIAGVLIYFCSDRAAKKSSEFDVILGFKAFQFGLFLTLIIWLVNGDLVENAMLLRHTSIALSYNDAGFMALMLIIVSTIMTHGRRLNVLIAFLFFGVSLLVLIKGLNKSSIVFMFLFFAIYFFEFRLSIKSFFLIFLVILALILFLVIFSDALEPLFSQKSSVASLTTLTGRTFIWGLTLDSINTWSKLIFGHGYGSAEVFFRDYVFTELNYAHAHNAVIQSLFEIGMLGSFFVHLIIFYNIKHSLYLVKLMGNKTVIPNIFLWLNLSLLFRGLTEPSYVQVGSFASYLIIMSFVFLRVCPFLVFGERVKSKMP
ncbi:O-antigen ligase family protein [Marinobacter sp. DY40_1A1]|uniref:O-antigen ligase family protein n=1 Tax=Marinobacter sp. DY40_1A1 TaxID=2583229 RepID=UPI001904E3B6|nr:O-antigen ligase family protein [Marinobacter sp. DY40_1A1]MBK1885433.1 O-antigen ligase family protein [Marinobacter sp. DY40_1A1]